MRGDRLGLDAPLVADVAAAVDRGIAVEPLGVEAGAGNADPVGHPRHRREVEDQTSGSTIDIEANSRSAGWNHKDDNVVETEFEIEVPTSAMLDLHAFSGNLIVRGTTGRIDAKTFSGDVDLDVSTASAAPDVKAETFSGDISARLPDVSNGHVRFNSFSGNFRSDFPVLLSNKSRRDISVDIGGGTGATLEFKTFSGDLKLVK